jgi:hypothetical protein
MYLPNFTKYADKHREPLRRWMTAGGDAPKRDIDVNNIIQYFYEQEPGPNQVDAMKKAIKKLCDTIEPNPLHRPAQTQAHAEALRLLAEIDGGPSEEE